MLEVNMTREELNTREAIREAIRNGGAVYADAQGVLRVTSRKA